MASWNPHAGMVSPCLTLIRPAEMSAIPSVVQPGRIRLLSWLLSRSEQNLPSLWPGRQGGAPLAKVSSRAFSLEPVGWLPVSLARYAFPPVCSCCSNTK